MTTLLIALAATITVGCTPAHHDPGHWPRVTPMDDIHVVQTPQKFVQIETRSFTVTNTVIHYPQRFESLPLPGEYLKNAFEIPAIGYGRYINEPNATTREIVVTVEKISVTEVPDLGVTITNSVERVCQIRTPQRAVTRWEDSGASARYSRYAR